MGVFSRTLLIRSWEHTERDNSAIKVKVHDLKKLAPLLKRVPQTLRGIPFTKMPKVHREDTRMEGRGTEVGSETDV